MADLASEHTYKSSNRAAGTQSKPRKPRVAKTLGQVMFATDTVTASMLRTLCMNDFMLQADFMTLYHERCAREKPSKSSFSNNWGRFIAWRNTSEGLWRRQRAINTAACIAHRRRLGLGRGSNAPNQVWFTLVTAGGSLSGSTPVAATPDQLLRHISDPDLTLAEHWSERALIQGDKDAPAWRALIALEIAYRSASVRSIVSPLFTRIATALRAAGTRFGDWYDDGCDDFNTPVLRGLDATAFEELRELAAGQDMTVVELLDYENIRWGAA